MTVKCPIYVLEHLHDKDYVHSDIKAENLMIRKVPISELANVKSAKLVINEGSPNKKKTAVTETGAEVTTGWY